MTPHEFVLLYVQSIINTLDDMCQVSWDKTSSKSKKTICRAVQIDLLWGSASMFLMILILSGTYGCSEESQFNSGEPQEIGDTTSIGKYGNDTMNFELDLPEGWIPMTREQVDRIYSNSRLKDQFRRHQTVLLRRYNVKDKSQLVVTCLPMATLQRRRDQAFTDRQF